MSEEHAHYHVDLICPEDWTDTQARLLAWRLADDALPRAVGVVVHIVHDSGETVTVETIQ